MTGSVQGVSGRRLTACKYMRGGVFLLSASDFPKGANDSYLDAKCRKRMPQPMGVTTDNFSSFSSQRKSFGADTSRNATLFPEKKS